MLFAYRKRMQLFGSSEVKQEIAHPQRTPPRFKNYSRVQKEGRVGLAKPR